jgi:YggT family protein
MPNPILWLILQILNIYSWIVIIQVILSLLISFGIVNRYQPFIQQVGMVLFRLTEPAYRRIRKYIPAISGVDLSPLVLILAIQFAQYSIMYWAR